MNPTTQPRLIFEQYLTYDNGTDNRYELVHEQLKLMNPPTLLHIKIVSVTVYQLQNKVYQKQEFRGSQQIISTTFPHLNLTAVQVLRAKL